MRCNSLCTTLQPHQLRLRLRKKLIDQLECQRLLMFLHLSLRVLLPQQLLVHLWLENCRCRRLLALASTISAALANRWLALP